MSRPYLGGYLFCVDKIIHNFDTKIGPATPENRICAAEDSLFIAEYLKEENISRFKKIENRIIHLNRIDNSKVEHYAYAQGYAIRRLIMNCPLCIGLYIYTLFFLVKGFMYIPRDFTSGVFICKERIRGLLNL